MIVRAIPRRRSVLRPRAIEIAAASVLSLVALSAIVSTARAQQAAQTAPSQGGATLPPVTIQQKSVPATKQKAAKAKAKPAAGQQTKASPAPQPVEAVADAAGDAAAAAASANAPVPPGARSGSLGVPNTAEARADIQTTPGGVDLVSDKEYKSSTPAVTIKDALDYVPGVFVQPKWGEDSRLSIRGSGLSRNFHLRGLQLFMDGIPINTADGFGDFQEIDPTAYRYIEVYKGSNALRFGANSLGGAINFVMPTGYDADMFGVRTDIGSFGFHKLSVSSGGVHGAADYFIAGTWQEQDGYRQHSDGESVRGAMNLGYRLTENVETRFYLNANSIEQRIPGSLTKDVALNAPRTAAAINVTNDWQRNIDSRPPRQQDHGADRSRHHGGVRRVLRRPPPDAPDLHVARPPVRGLWRLRAHLRPARDRGLPQPARGRRQRPQRRERQPLVRQPAGRGEGAIGATLDRYVAKHRGLSRERVLCPAADGARRRHAVPARGT